MKRIRNKRGDAITLSIITVAFVGAIFTQAIVTDTLNEKPVCSAYLFDNDWTCTDVIEYGRPMTLRPHAQTVKGYFTDIPGRSSINHPASGHRSLHFKSSIASLRPHRR